jgi:hypothetical protein
MRTLSVILTVAALVVAMAAPAHAADIFTPSLQSDGPVLFACAAVNKSTTTNMTVTITAIAPGVGSLGSCPQAVVAPQRGTACAFPAAGVPAYCKITTSNAGNTRGNLMLWDSGSAATSSVDAK